jgi:hypothetical protein
MFRQLPTMQLNQEPFRFVQSKLVSELTWRKLRCEVVISCQSLSNFTGVLPKNCNSGQQCGILSHFCNGYHELRQ